MVITLQNKLFQFEITRKGWYKELFLFYLSTDIIELVDKVKEKGLYYQLTGHELEVVDKVKEYHQKMSFLCDAIM